MKEYFVWLFKLLTLVVIFLVVVPLMMAVLMAAKEGGISDSISGDKHQVAVVELTGVIDTSKEILEELHKQARNEKVKGIVLRIDSPGGAVGPSQDIYEAVKSLKAQKPIIASMGTVAASGGLYSALGATKVFAQPGTITGSIGVILQIPNVSKVTDKFGVDMVTIKSGKLKDVGNAFRQMTDEERDFLQSTVTAAHQDFISAVAEGRHIKREEVQKFADGRIILGSQAKQLGLVDEFGDVYQAARAVFDVLGTPLAADESPKLMYPHDPYGQLKKILEGVSQVVGFSSLFSQSMQLKYIMY